MLYIGVRRIVLIIGPVVIKIPRIRPIYFSYFVRNLVNEYADYRKSHYPNSDFFRGKLLREDIKDTIKKYLFGGIIENVLEAKCYLLTRHRLLAPLYLPLIILNIYGKESGVGNFDEDKLLDKINELGYTQNEEWVSTFRRCIHTFESLDNLAFDGKKVKILDYGEKGIKSLLLKYGDRIEELLLFAAKPSK